MRNIVVTGGAGFTLFLHTPLAENWVEPWSLHKPSISKVKDLT